MSRQNNITYAAVADACRELIEQGDKPSIRKICNRVGGSYSTLSTLYHRWEDEQTLANKVDTALSDAFLQASLVEIGRATAALKQKLTEQLDSEKARLKDAQSLLTEYEERIQILKDDLGINQRTAEQKHLKLERELAAANALIEDSTKREALCQSQMETLRQAVHQTELKMAVLETERKAIEKENLRLEKEVEALKNLVG